MAENLAQPSDYELKACPFCGGTVRILVCDDEGNIHHEDGYEQDPWSGLGYQLAHDETMTGSINCPISAFEGEVTGRNIYDTREEATAFWNRRI